MIGYDTQRSDSAPTLRQCPDCGRLTDWDIMIWLNGRCTCPACYTKRRAALDAEERRESDD